jgi:hypothetical protein
VFGPELGVEQRRIGNRETPGEVVAAFQLRIHHLKTPRHDLPAPGLHGLMVSGIGGVAGGGEDAGEALAVDRADGVVHPFQHADFAGRVVGEQLAPGYWRASHQAMAWKSVIGRPSSRTRVGIVALGLMAR